MRKKTVSEREKLLENCFDCFCKHGLEGTSTQKLSATCGMSPGNIFTVSAPKMRSSSKPRRTAWPKWRMISWPMRPRVPPKSGGSFGKHPIGRRKNTGRSIGLCIRSTPLPSTASTEANFLRVYGRGIRNMQRNLRPNRAFPGRYCGR